MLDHQFIPYISRANVLKCQNRVYQLSKPQSSNIFRITNVIEVGHGGGQGASSQTDPPTSYLSVYTPLFLYGLVTIGAAASHKLPSGLYSAISSRTYTTS